MKRVWKTPELDYYNLYADMLQQPHLLIAGATGSGKSVVINGMMTTALKDSPAAVQFILIDPKRVELVDYKELPHTLRYSSEPGEMIQALQEAITMTDNRYRDMARQHVKKYGGGAVYVVIDELADLMTTNKKQVQPILQKKDMEVQLKKEMAHQVYIEKEQVIFWLEKFREGDINDEEFCQTVIDLFVNSVTVWDEPDDKFRITIAYNLTSIPQKTYRLSKDGRLSDYASNTPARVS